MKSLVNLLIAIVLLLGVAAFAFWGYQRISGNLNEIIETKTALMRTLNREFRRYHFDNLVDMSLPGTSMFTGVPDDVYFSEPAWETDHTGKRFCKATVEGTYHRGSGEVDLAIDFTQESRARVKKTLPVAAEEAPQEP